MVVYATHPDADSIVVRLVCHRSSVASTSAVFSRRIDSTPMRSPPSPARPDLQSVAVSPATIGAVVDEGAAAYFVVAYMPADAAHLLWGVRIGYVTADAGRFFPIDPVRAYDSRAALPEPGLLGPNSSRVILVKDSRANGSGAVLAADVVPVGATAIACNLTVTGTDRSELPRPHAGRRGVVHRIGDQLVRRRPVGGERPDRQARRQPLRQGVVR